MYIVLKSIGINRGNDLIQEIEVADRMELRLYEETDPM